MTNKVYFVASADGYIKIGFTADLDRRMTALRTSVPPDAVPRRLGGDDRPVAGED